MAEQTPIKEKLKTILQSVDKEKLKTLLQLAKRRKLPLIGGAGALVLLALMALGRRAEEEPQQPLTPTSPEPQPPQQPQQQPDKPKQPTEPPKPKQPTKPPQAGDFLPIKALYEIATLSAMYGKEYEVVKNAYLQVYNQYQQQLDKLIPALTVLAMKTPLSALTSEDLPEKVRNLFMYSSYQSAVRDFPKLVQGYYIAKINGLTTDHLTELDLMTIAENPAFVQNVNENYLKVVSTLAETLKLQMDSILRQVGLLKDEYKVKLDSLQNTAKILKSIADITTKQQELKLKATEIYSDIAFKNQKLQLEKQKLQLGEEKLQLEKQKLLQKQNPFPQIEVK